jgi:hypothetical protein
MVVDEEDADGRCVGVRQGVSTIEQGGAAHLLPSPVEEPRVPKAIQAVTMLGVASLLLASPATVDAACGGGGDELMARFVRDRADTIFLARVGERDDSGIVTLHVIDRYRGDPAATMEVDDESLQCRSFSDVAGDRILVATGMEKPDDYAMPPVEPGRWWIAWFHFPGFGWQAGMLDRYRGLDSLLAALQLLPDTASGPTEAGSGADRRGVLFGIGLAAWIGLGLGRLRRRLKEPTRS